MGKYIVFEEVGNRGPRRGEHYWYGENEIAFRADEPESTEVNRARPILRRLTDAEVDALVAPQPADDERGRFVRECAMRLFLNIEARCMAAGMAEGEWESRRDEFARTAIADATALAARLWEKRA